MPLSDPIVEEIHAIREAMAKASNDDLRKIAEAARSRQAAGGRKVVNLPPMRAATAKKASATTCPRRVVARNSRSAME
jgi:hypothetical protein